MKKIFLLFSILGISCIRLEPSLLDTSKNPAALLASFLLASTTGAAGTGTGSGTLAASSFITQPNPYWAAVNPSANLLYVTSDSANKVTVFNATTGAYAF